MINEVAPRLDGPPVLVIANQKGGVGKTATALEITAAAAQNGHRALLIDMDPQANATRSLGLEPEECAITTGDLLSRQRAGSPITLAEAIHRTEWPRVDVVPSNLDLAKGKPTATWTCRTGSAKPCSEPRTSSADTP